MALDNNSLGAVTLQSLRSLAKEHWPTHIHNNKLRLLNSGL